MIIAGIDPGISPAIAFLNSNTDFAEAFRVEDLLEGPDSATPLVALLRKFNPEYACLELVGPMPGQGLGSTARFMCAYGIIRGALSALDIPYSLVVPPVWKKALLPPAAFEEKVDKGKRKDQQKKYAVEFAQARFPEVQLVSAGCRVPDHNLAESLCLAAYGLLHPV